MNVQSLVSSTPHIPYLFCYNPCVGERVVGFKARLHHQFNQALRVNSSRCFVFCGTLAGHLKKTPPAFASPIPTFKPPDKHP